MNGEDKIVSILEETRGQIQRNLEEKKINASGRTSRSIQVRKTPTGYRLGSFPDAGGVAPLFTLEIGRPGGKVPSRFKSMIFEWTKLKGWTFQSEGQRWGAATTIVKNIKANGTQRHRIPEDVYSTPIRQAEAELSKQLHTLFATTIHNVIELNF